MTLHYWQSETDKTIIECKIVGDWSWEDFQKTMQQIRTVVFPIKDRTDMIIDMHEAGPLPMSAATLQLKAMLDRMPEQFGIVALVSEDNFTKMVVDSLNRAIPETKSRLFLVESAKIAHRLITIGRIPDSDDAVDAATRPVVPRR